MLFASYVFKVINIHIAPADKSVDVDFLIPVNSSVIINI